MVSTGSSYLWGLFALIVVSVLAIDLGLFNRRAREMTHREALVWTLVWFGLALGFDAFVFVEFGAAKAADFFQAWVIEETLSVDNIFVFLVILRYFKVPRSLHHRVLFWGIIGAIVARGAFIFAGSALVERFHSVMYLFGAILLFTSWKLLFQDEEEEVKLDRNLIVRFYQRFVPMIYDYRGTALVVREDRRLLATPLMCVLTIIPATDIVFAVDSIPAVFGVTTDVFIVYTSNIFAVMGLRSLTFLLSGAMDRFHYLKNGLALILAFIGTRIMIASWYTIPSTISLGVVVLTLAVTAVASLAFPKQVAPQPSPDSADDPPAS